VAQGEEREEIQALFGEGKKKKKKKNFPALSAERKKKIPVRARKKLSTRGKKKKKERKFLAYTLSYEEKKNYAFSDMG
jgi:hypothetical protein